MINQTPLQDIIVSIINDAISAPSGENSQPWKFTIENNVLHVFNIPRTSHVIYNSKEKSSYFTHGALLEIVSISASHYGYVTEMNIFPDENKPNHVATIALKKKTYWKIFYILIFMNDVQIGVITQEKLSEKKFKMYYLLPILIRTGEPVLL